jgi:hypothetical protein
MVLAGLAAAGVRTCGLATEAEEKRPQAVKAASEEARVRARGSTAAPAARLLRAVLRQAPLFWVDTQSCTMVHQRDAGGQFTDYRSHGQHTVSRRFQAHPSQQLPLCILLA